MENLYEIAKYFLNKNAYLTDKQVQKLVYYAYSWYIVHNNSDKNNITNRLCQQHPEAWAHGPVFNDLYQEMTHNRKSFHEDQFNLNDDIKKFLDVIYKVYGKYTGNQLEDMTHKELPWIIARNGLSANERSRNPINDSDIYEYYSN